MYDDGSTTEEWRVIPGWDGRYEVSDMGRVRALRRTQRTASGALGTWKPRIMKRTPDACGRCSVMLSRPPASGQARRDARRQAMVGVFVLEAFVGPRPPGHECCHINGDCSDDRLVNLRWGTRADNVADAMQHGTLRTPKNHISDAAVRAMCCAYRHGISTRVLRERFSVSARTVTHITKWHTRQGAGDCACARGDCCDFPEATISDDFQLCAT